MIRVKTTGLGKRVGTGDFWSNFGSGLTSLYRSVNPFVSASGQLETWESFSANATQLYRDLNPFVTSSGQLINSTTQLGDELTQLWRGVNPFISETGASEIAGIDFEMGKSPFWRDWGGTVATLGLTALTGGMALPALASIGITGALASAVVGAVAGVGGSVVQSKINEYTVKVEKAGLEQAVAQYDADIDKMKKLGEQLDAEQQKNLQLAIAELEKARNNASMKVITQKALPVVGALAGLYFITGG